MQRLSPHSVDWGPMLQKEQGCLKKIMKGASTSHTAGLNQSVRDSKNVHHLFSARSLSCSHKKKERITLNIFHGTIFLPIKSKTVLETP